MLTPRQKECLDFIIRYQRESGGVSPSVVDINLATGSVAKSGNGHRFLQDLEERGFIRRLPFKARAIEVLQASPSKPIPIYDARTLQLKGYLPL